MALDLKLGEKPFWVGILIGVGIAALAIFLGEYLYFSGMTKEIKAQQDKLGKLLEDINKGKAAERKIVQLKEEMKKLELELEKLLRILPQQYNADEIVKKVETLASQGEFVVKKIAPGGLERKDFYAEWPIKLELDGSYHNLALFFDKLAKFQRIINVTELHVTAASLSSTGDTKRTINAQFTAKTFIYQGDAPASSGPSGGGPK